MESRDPFDNVSLEEIKDMPESEYRLYMIHQTQGIRKEVRDIKKMLKKRPEVVRANIALLVSVGMGFMAFISFMMMITGG